MKTRTFRLDKLVRDKIVQNHIGSGGEVVARRLQPSEKMSELLRKLITEELPELETSANPVAEFADVQEILDQIAKDKGITKEEIAAVQAKKREQNGGFENGDFIETETWPAEHHWAKYYAAEPERFREVEGGPSGRVNKTGRNYA